MVNGLKEGVQGSAKTSDLHQGAFNDFKKQHLTVRGSAMIFENPYFLSLGEIREFNSAEDMDQWIASGDSTRKLPASKRHRISNFS